MSARADRYGLFARTPVGDFRVNGWSSWENVHRRFLAATAGGTRVTAKVRAFVNDRWQDFDGYLAVRSAADPAFTHAPVANKRSEARSATVRAHDYRKVR